MAPGSKLTFKGDARKKKKKTKHSSSADGTSGSSSNPRGEGSSGSKQAREGWIALEFPEQAHGPLHICMPPSDDAEGVSRPATCLAVNMTLNTKVFPHVLSDEQSLDEPDEISHVWVVSMVPGADDKVNLRAANGHFLSVDSVGTVACPSEARGPQEEFQILKHPSLEGRYLLRSVLYGGIISIDEVAGGKLDYRGDVKLEDASSQDEAFKINMQGQFEFEWEKRQETQHKTKPTDDGLVVVSGNLKDAENQRIMSMQARGHGRLVSSTEDSRDLKRARNSGALSEAMLDRRMKLKSDRYC